MVDSSPFHPQGMDAIPIDLLLGSMSSELYHVLGEHLPQEVRGRGANNHSSDAPPFQ